VRTLRAAAQLLANAGNLDALGAIASAVGCVGAVVSLDDALLHDMGLDPVRAARVVDGPGSLRALLVELGPELPLRDELTRVATRLAARTPQILWIVLATRSSTSSTAILAWRGDRRPPKVAALVIDRDRILDSDAETLATLIAAADQRPDADVLTHERWVEILGREALTRRFYRELEVRVGALGASLSRGSTEERHTLALLYSSRLLFLSFLEAKGWLDGDRAFLGRTFDRCMSTGGSFHRRVLLPLFFGTLNTRWTHRAPAARALGRIPFLNGGLFARTPNERRLRGATFPDEEIGKLFGELFARYRFTAREESTEWVELAVDPEMLGKAFESLMAQRDRKGSGSYYTPHALVARVAEAALGRLVDDTPDRCYAASLDETTHLARNAHRARLDGLTILDPACGSGAFLVYALERLAELRRAAGDDRALSEIRRDVLTRSIFGVDKNPTAVWLCELRLWLSVVIESDIDNPLDVRPLPNLDRNVRIGDSLAADLTVDGIVALRRCQQLRRLRLRYARATGPRKSALVRLLDREERRIAFETLERELTSVTAQRRDVLSALRSRDLFGTRSSYTSEARTHSSTLRARAGALRAEQRRLTSGGALPFSFPVHFADVMARGGFDVIIGNPPWVRLHRIPVRERELFRRQYRVFRAGAWESGAERARAGSGFGSQVDLAALFIERSVRLLRPGAVMSLLVPAKLWQSLAGGGVRRLLTEESRIVELEDLTEAPSSFDAAVYPSLVVAERWSGADDDWPGEIIAACHHRGCGSLRWRLPRRTLAFDETPGSPWLILPPEVRHAFDRLRLAGVPLAESRLGRPHLGVKTGFNLAFLVRRDAAAPGFAGVLSANGRRGVVEDELLRPVVRGENIHPWRVDSPNECIVWTHGARGAPIDRLPPQATRWLTPWRRQLSARSDGRSGRWWSIFRVEAARTDLPRVVWADLGRVPRAAMLHAGDPSVPLNTCYVAICRDETDACALTALLNSPLAEAWLAALAEPARGGYRRFLGWTLALLPIPADWERARTLLAPVAQMALRADRDPLEIRDQLLHATLAAFELTHDDVAPLLTWFCG
jgi:N-6 DNA Methylase